jgi:hypothetical protein
VNKANIIYVDLQMNWQSWLIRVVLMSFIFLF